MEEIMEGYIVNINNSLKTYGADFKEETGTVIEVYPNGHKGFNEPCAKVLFTNIKLKFGTHEVTKTIAPYIKMVDIVVVAKGTAKNIRMPDIKFDVSTKLILKGSNREAAVKSVKALKDLEQIDQKLFDKIDNALADSMGLSPEFKAKFDDKKKKLKQELKKKLKEVSSMEKNVTAYRVVNGKRIEFNMPFDKSALKTDIKKVKRNLDLKVREHRSELKNNTISSDAILGIPVTRLGVVFDKGGQILNLQKQIPKDRIMAVKKPLLKDEYIGVELECVTDLSHDQLRKEFIKAKLERYVDVVTDGSLRVDSERGGETVEVRVLCLNRDKLDVLKRVTKVLLENGGYVNKSCGTHVHFDMRRTDVNKAFNNLVRIQSILKAAQSSSRRNAEYCKNNTSHDMNSVDYNGSARYWTINPKSFTKHKTLEVRVHEGTLDAEGLCGWVDFIFAVAKSDLLTKNYIKLKTLTEVVPNIPKTGLDYMTSRIEMYA